MQRPTGVVVIGILYILGAVFAILAGLGAFIFGGAFLAHFASAGMPVGGAVAAMVSAIGVVLIVFGVFALIIAIGLFGLKNWARIVAMALAALGVIFGLLALLPLALHFAMFRIFYVLIRIAINALILWYLNQPDVKKAFGA